MVVFNIQDNKFTNGQHLKNSDSNREAENPKIVTEKEEPEKIETCYTCGKKFDMNKEEGARYRCEKYPLCAYCAEFYGFYFDDPGQKRREK
jgi:hypothetical protein